MSAAQRTTVAAQQEVIWLSEEAGKAVRYDREPLAGFWRRLLSELLAAFAPGDLL